VTERPDLLPPEATTPIGGPLGRYAAPRTWAWRRIVSRLVALTAVPVAISVGQKGHCVVNGWSGDEQFWRACFSDLPAQYQLGGLSSGVPGYLDGTSTVDQPVVSGTVMSLLGQFVPSGGVLDQTRWYFLMWAVLVTVLLMVTVWCTAATLPDHLESAAQVALSPIIIVTALLSSDVLAVALVAAAMLAWERRWLLPTGVLLGVGVLTRGYVIVVAIALLYAAWRADRLGEARRVVATGAVTTVAVGLGFAVVNAEATFAAYRAWWETPASYGSAWLIPQLVGFPLPSLAVTGLAVLGWLAALGMGWVFTRDAWRAPSWAQVAFVMVAIVAVTGKSFPVQASLWLLPLAALAGVRWRDQLLWASAEALHFVAVWLYIGGLTVPDRGLPGPWYLVALLLRTVAIGYLVTRVWSAAVYPPVPRPVPAVPVSSDPGDGDSARGAGAGILDGFHTGALDDGARPGTRSNPPVTEGP
jgi:hypothetical protein